MIITVLVIIAIIIAIIAFLNYKYDSYVLVCTQCILLTIFIFGFISVLVLFISHNIDADAKKDALIVEQNLLNKQIEEHWYNNLTENGKRDLVDKIEEYNKNLAYNKKNYPTINM